MSPEFCKSPCGICSNLNLISLDPSESTPITQSSLVISESCTKSVNFV